MIIPASQVLRYLPSGSSIKVISMEGLDAFEADYVRVKELVDRSQVCGHVKGATLKRLELIVPISETITPRVQIETAASVNARTNLGAYRQHLETQSCWALCMSSV